MDGTHDPRLAATTLAVRRRTLAETGLDAAGDLRAAVARALAAGFDANFVGRKTEAGVAALLRPGTPPPGPGPGDGGAAAGASPPPRAPSPPTARSEEREIPSPPPSPAPAPAPAPAAPSPAGGTPSPSRGGYSDYYDDSDEDAAAAGGRSLQAKWDRHIRGTLPRSDTGGAWSGVSVVRASAIGRSLCAGAPASACGRTA